MILRDKLSCAKLKSPGRGDFVMAGSIEATGAESVLRAKSSF